MAKQDDRFLEKLLATFRIEAEEHIRAITSGLLELEKASEGSDATEIIETMYREAHSLKGAARSVDVGSIEAVCQAVETVFGTLKRGKWTPHVELFDILHRAANTMTDALSTSEETDVEPLVTEILALLEGGAVGQRASGRSKELKKPIKDSGWREKVKAPAQSHEVMPERAEARQRSVFVPESGLESADPELTTRQVRSVQTETVRIAVDKLDPLLRQVEEMVSLKLTTNQRLSDLQSLMSIISQWKQKWTSISSHDSSFGKMSADKSKTEASGPVNGGITKLKDFLEWSESCVESLEKKLRALIKTADGDSRTHGQMVDDLLEDMMNVLMLPCSSLVEVLPRLVRDLARDAGKEVDLDIRGGDREIDRRILEEMKDSLIHLVRNSIDHGIEHPEVRERDGKPRRGTIAVAFSQVSGNQVELVVSDDGAGIDVVRVREAAARRGMLNEADKRALDDQEALSLVFRSEVSTSATVASISGRGLGLAIVRAKVENLGGSVSVATSAHVGTSFRILLPVTLSTFRGILVYAYGQPFILPTSHVERVVRINKDLVKTVRNEDTIEVNGRAIPLVRLGDTLELARASQEHAGSLLIPVLILRSGETLVGFSVDAVHQEQEVLVKGLGRQLSRVRNVAGATVLGSGRLVPILNVQDLVKSSVRRSFADVGPAVGAEQIERPKKNVLVVEDSITSRMLLKNILESSGYEVTTTVDGAEAWASLKGNHFDLVVADIEMPRMDGFQLTANIRGDDKLGDMPVVLVTSLASREDRERGVDVGANAYICKGSFDQNNLLEIIERLI